MLLECSLLLQLPFNILFIPSAPLSRPPATQQISEKNLHFSQPSFMFRRTTVSDWHTETGSAPGKGLPEYTVNTTPSDGLQVKFCLWGSETQAQHLLVRPPQQRHPQQEFCGCCCGRKPPPTPAYLWSESAHRHPGTTTPRRIAAGYLHRRTKPPGVLWLPPKNGEGHMAELLALALGGLELMIQAHAIMWYVIRA